MRNMQVRVVKSHTTSAPLAKADTSVQVAREDAHNAGDWITPLHDMHGLRNLVKNSTVLPQCIRAYRDNIAGFGIGVRYIEDAEETEEMAAEFERAQEIIELLTIEQDTKEVFADIIEARETYGIAYLEVIRNLAGEVQQIEFVRETPSVRKTKPLAPYVSTVYYHHGREVERKKRFCKYKQEIGGRVVYFKEFGDPRIMDNRDGTYLADGETLELQFQANELMEFSIGTQPYGEVRWIGQVLGVDGSRKAEMLNNNYFENGRHTPLMILIKGGTLTDDSFAKLQGYMNDIKGAAGQHAFIILETESTDGRTDFDQQEKPEIEIKDLANILQRDELFQDYLDNNRRKVQSSFRLPDLYVGYTTDFNRATAQTAQEVTEEQVFQPERKSLAWAVNNLLLNGYRFKYVEAYFLEPNISNPDDLYKLLTVCNNAGGLTPNKAKEILYEAFGEVSENYPGEWGDVPLAQWKAQGGGLGLGSLAMQMQGQIEKAAENRDDEVLAVMKAVKKLLLDREKGFTNGAKCDIIKTEWNEDDHPRDESGRFTSVGGGSGNNSGSDDPRTTPESTGSAYAGERISSYISNPKSLGDTTHKEKHDDFIQHGVDVKPLSDGSQIGRPYEDGGGYKVNDEKDGLLLYHPEEGSHHGGEYYKLSNGKIGTKRYDMEGNEIRDPKNVKKGVRNMIKQEKFFEGLDFEKVELSGEILYKGIRGHFYRIDQGDCFIAIEAASDENEVQHNWFEDADLFDVSDTEPEEVVFELVRQELAEHYARNAPNPF